MWKKIRNTNCDKKVNGGELLFAQETLDTGLFLDFVNFFLFFSYQRVITSSTQNKLTKYLRPPMRRKSKFNNLLWENEGGPPFLLQNSNHYFNSLNVYFLIEKCMHFKVFPLKMMLLYPTSFSESCMSCEFMASGPAMHYYTSKSKPYT